MRSAIPTTRSLLVTDHPHEEGHAHHMNPIDLIEGSVSVLPVRSHALSQRGVARSSTPRPSVSVAPNTTCPRSLLFAPELGTKTEGGWATGTFITSRAIVPTPGISVPVRATKRSLPFEKRYNPVSGTPSPFGVGIQGGIEDDFAGVVHVDLPTDDGCGGHESSASWHLVARARHRDGHPAPVQINPGDLIGGGRRREVAEKGDGSRVVQHRAESLPKHASAGGLVTCVRDGPDLTGGAVLDVEATKDS